MTKASLIQCRDMTALSGHLAWLESKRRIPVCCSFLLQMDLAACRGRQAAVEAVRRLERALADSLGLALVFAPSHLTPSDEYRGFLERLASGAAEKGPIFAPTAPDLSLQATGGLSISGSEDEVRNS